MKKWKPGTRFAQNIAVEKKYIKNVQCPMSKKVSQKNENIWSNLTLTEINL